MELMLNQDFGDVFRELRELKGDLKQLAFCSQVPLWLQLPPELSHFTRGEECRLALQQRPDITTVIVGEDVEDVAPLNLVYALVKDRPDLKVYVLSTEDDETLRRHSVLAGALGVLDEEQLRTIFNEGPKPLPQVVSASQQEKTGWIFGFVSASGGVGKSTLALIMALLAQARGLRVALLDMDLQFGDIPFMVSREDARFSFYDLRSDNLDAPCIGEEYLSDAAGNIAGDWFPVVIASNSMGPEYAESLLEGIPAFLKALRSQFDVVLVDSPAFWNDAQAQLLEIADTVFLVMDQRSLAIKACKVADDLCGRMGIPEGKIVHLLNRCSRKGILSSLDISFGLGRDSVVELPDGGGDIDELLGLGQPYELWENPRALLTALDELLVASLEGRGLTVPSAKRPREQKKEEQKPRTRAASSRRVPRVNFGEGGVPNNVLAGTRCD